MNAHTPEPWKVSPHPNPGFGFRIVAPCPSEQEPDGELFVAQDIGNKANADLMAAAPDMLKSLRLAAATFESARTALLQIGALSEAEHIRKAMAAMAAGCDVAARSTRDLIARVEGGP